MAETALRPRSGLEIIDAAFSLLKRDYLKFVTIMGIGYLPYLIAFMLVMRTVGSEATGVAIAGGVMMVPSMIWLSVVYTAMTVAASDVYLGREINIAAALRHTLSRFWPILGAGILRVLAMFVGFFFLLVGLIWAWVTFFAATTVVVLEGTSSVDAMRRSADLTAGFRWPVFGTLAVTYIISNFLLGLAIIPAFFIDTEVLPTVLSTIVTILVQPFNALVETLLYYDLRIRKEGFDIELMTKDLGDAALGQPAG